MAGTGKPSIVAAFIVAWGLVGLVPTAAMAQFPIPMIPNFNFGPQHYRSGSSHYSTSHSRAHQNEDSAPDKTKEKDATQVESPNNNGPSGRPQPGGPVQSPSRSVESDASTRQSSSAGGNNDQPAFSPSR